MHVSFSSFSGNPYRLVSGCRGVPQVAQPEVQHVETAASESNLDLAHLVSHAVTEACRDSNLSMIGSVGEVPEEQRR